MYCFLRSVFLGLSSLLLGCANGLESSETLPQNSVDTAKLDSLIGVVQMELIGKLSGAIEAHGIASAAEFCSNQAQQLTDSLSRILGYSIRRVSDKHRNPKNSADTYDLEVMQAFRMSAKEGSMSVAQWNETDRKYYKPIVLGMPLCLKCHGSVNERDALAYEVIRKNYPADLAIDYALGDLRGMWVVAY